MMTRCCTAAVLSIVAVAGSLALAQPAKDTKVSQPAKTDMKKDMGDMQLPPGWTEADMKACMDAGMPGPMHNQLTKNAGTWAGKCTMWMAPGSEPMKSECTTTITPMMDGRFTKIETAGEMPGMGPFQGFGLTGYDNVAKKFQMTWIDSCGTTMMQGTGELSSDQKTMTWNHQFTCPIQKKMVTMRQVEQFNSDNSMTLSMFMNDPKSGKEYKMMEIAYTRSGPAPTKSASGDSMNGSR